MSSKVCKRCGRVLEADMIICPYCQNSELAYIELDSKNSKPSSYKKMDFYKSLIFYKARFIIFFGLMILIGLIAAFVHISSTRMSSYKFMQFSKCVISSNDSDYWKIFQSTSEIDFEVVDDKGDYSILVGYYDLNNDGKYEKIKTTSKRVRIYIIVDIEDNFEILNANGSFLLISNFSTHGYKDIIIGTTLGRKYDLQNTYKYYRYIWNGRKYIYSGNQ